MREDPRLRVFSGVLRRPGTPQWSLGAGLAGRGGAGLPSVEWGTHQPNPPTPAICCHPPALYAVLGKIWFGAKSLMLNKSSEIKVMTNVFECCLCVSSFIAGKVLRTVCGLQYKYSKISCCYYYRYLIQEVVVHFNPHLGN